MYGVIPDKNAVHAFYGRVPCVDKNEGYKTCYFSSSNYSSPYDAASKWVNKVGVEIWGLTRWLMIKEGKLRRMRSLSHSVTVKPVVQHNHQPDGSIVGYTSFVVRWYDDDLVETTKWFGPKRWRTLEKAEIAAHRFAAKKRAEHTGGELHLPESLS
ncbi:hypothetical protein [Photobacterium sp.]|uniref:hypothetical protein n=1 Tax=Photobacterium sp. TaxID=660 RepID=UPI00299DEE88|nr:hypothetical protein [Photobacterium sp.]MDX1300945.1 hypothetical protein [Photobacterium sp.]